MQLRSSVDLTVDDTVVAAEFELKPGQTAEFVLEVGETCGGDAPSTARASTSSSTGRFTSGGPG